MHEGYSFWVFVLEADDNGIRTWEESGHPSRIPSDVGRLKHYANSDDLKARFADQFNPTYWV